jgi:ELWxxDGT repeat protein
MSESKRRRRIAYLVSITRGTMKKIAVLLTLIFLSSLMSGCAGDDNSTEKDERITDLESELSNMTVEVDALNGENIFLQQTLAESESSLLSMNQNYENLSSQLAIVQWHKDNISFSLSQTMELLNNSDNVELISSLEIQILNFTSDIDNLELEISELNNQLINKQEQINELSATIAALQSTLGSLTYNINDKVNKCPQDNPGLELIIGYDDGNGNALPDDGVLQNDEIQSRIGECPGDNGMVQEFQNNSGGFGPSLLVEMGGILYFTGDDGIHGWELWRSDGTVGGTYMVKDVREEECTQTTNPGTGEETENCVNYGSMYVMCWPGDRCFFPELVAGENKIFFTGFDSNSNVNFPHVFVSDGTEEGTYRVRDQWINWDYNCAECDFNYSGPSNLMVIPDDGFNPDRLLYTVIQAICIGDYCNTEFYPASGEELWMTDGTDAGTIMLINLVPEEKSWGGGNYCCQDDKGGIARDIIMKGGTIWFTAETEDYGRELYRYGLTVLSGGLFLIKDINLGAEGSNPMYLTSGSNGAYLSADNGSTGQELFFSQGDAFSTRLVKDIWPGTNNSSEPMNLIKFGQKLIFTADDGQNGRELWVSDSTESGTYMIKDINSNGSSSPNELIIMDGLLYFMAYTEEYGRELWKSDGTEAGTVMVKDINPGNNSSFYWESGFMTGDLTVIHQGELYFSADDGGTYGVEVWRTDGTSEGTRIAVDINLGSNSSWPLFYVSVGEKLFFQGETAEYGRELWYHWDNPGPIIGVTDNL